MFNSRRGRNRRNGRDDVSSILGFLQPGPIRRTRPRVTPAPGVLGPIGSKWGILASEPASREMRPPPAHPSFLNQLPSMAGISSVTLDQFRFSASSAPTPSAISPPLIPQEVFLDSSSISPSPPPPPPPPMQDPPIITDGPVPPPSPPKQPSVSESIGTAGSVKGYQPRAIPLKPKPFLPEARIHHAVATARLSLANDENRFIQSPWLSRDITKTRYAPSSTSKLSVMEIFDKVASKPKPLGLGPPPAPLEEILKYF